MKRGLVVLDPAEVPPSEHAGRVEAVQAELRRRGLDGAVVYGDTYRADDVNYLTNLCMYWNECVLLVPASGEPTFLTKLSARTHTWMKQTSTLTDVRSGKDLAAMVRDAAAEAGLRGLAVVDGELWPRALLERIRSAAPGVQLQDAGDIVRQQRKLPSAATLALLRDAGAAMGAAMAGAEAEPAPTAAAIRGLLDSRLRGAGFADVITHTDPAPGGGLSVRVTGQYRYTWVAAARTLDGTPADGGPAGGGPQAGGGALVAAARGAAAAAAGLLAPGVDPAALAKAAGRALEGADGLASWSVELIDHTDLSDLGDVRAALGGDTGSPAGGAVVALDVTAVAADGTRARHTDTFLVGDGAATALTRTT